ncbi:PaaX family transcriptional regulator [Streptomyces sp. N2-109]|uniref:PaaX family transcriptional regulator n=1 Tax=Streptomyces gossypii TaxID=2883101 RepID=A0ABT2JYZ8_9ACTN|nr:PaaX family transcriptional regulator C-terminal domain-containing protein [Streptomyces gossypii]MCT2593123.1 PaaX family transcriptional regulator [Streptomyces gossypii]
MPARSARPPRRPAGPAPRTAADAPTVSRRHQAGAESARGLLFTVLGELVLPSGEPAWTSAFIDVLGRLGVEEKASRQALMRTAADGWLTSERVGRRTRWTLSRNAESLLTEGAARIYGFQGMQREWDGRWLLVVARVPESDRSARHLLRTRLTWAGFGSPAPGLWVSTHPDRMEEAERVLGEAGVLGEAQIFLGEHRGGGELSAMVRQAWDLDAIEESYEEFLGAFASRTSRTSRSSRTSRDTVVRLVELVHAWRSFPLRDPELPAALLPARWSGGRAADRFRRRHGQWAADGRAEWGRITGSAG